MLKLICDHCGLSIELIHHMTPKKEDTDGGDGQGYRMFWEISSEQSGIGYANEGYCFDRDPQELDAWEWNGPMGTYGKDSIGGHFCLKCKEKYKQYLKDYVNQKISLEDLLKDQDLTSVGTLTAKAKELKDKLDRDYREYKEKFKASRAD